MPLVNGTFLTPGTQRYDAAEWSRLVTDPTGYVFAGFAVDVQDEDGKERFESGWGDKKFSFTGFFQDLTYAFFDFSVNSPKNAEDFEDLWGAGPASVMSGPSPYALVDGQTLLVSVLDAAPVTITFRKKQFTSIASARPEEVVNALNAVLVNARATFRGKHVYIVTTKTGPTAHIRVTGGTANAALDFSLEEQAGAPEGATFFRRIEFNLFKFTPEQAELESFDKGWGPSLVSPDPADSSGRLILVAAESFAGWSTLVTTDAQFTATTAPEVFNGWVDSNMQTFVDEVD